MKHGLGKHIGTVPPADLIIEGQVRTPSFLSMLFSNASSPGLLRLGNHLGDLHPHHQTLHPPPLHPDIRSPPLLQESGLHHRNLLRLLGYHGDPGLRPPMPPRAIHLGQKRQRNLYQCALVLHHRLRAQRSHRFCPTRVAPAGGVEPPHHKSAEDFADGDLHAGIAVSPNPFSSPRRD